MFLFTFGVGGGFMEEVWVVGSMGFGFLAEF